MLEKLRKLNDSILNCCKNNEEKYNKHILIKKILTEDNCFFKMNVEQAYSILRELNIDEKSLKSVYCSLIDSSNYN